MRGVQTGHNQRRDRTPALVALARRLPLRSSADAAAARPAHSVIVSPRKSTVIQRNGAVRSVQSAVLTMTATDLERLWTPANLENLARTYWRFLSRVTLGLIRVKYTADSRSVVLLGRPLTLLRFGAPEYTIEDDHGPVRWPIRDGLLVARAGRGSGFLGSTCDASRRGRRGATRGPATCSIEVEVANFYPSISRASRSRSTR